MQIKFGRADRSKKEFGLFLMTVRGLESVSRSDLAQKVGMTTEALARIERGEISVTIQRAAMFFEALRVRASIKFNECGGVTFYIYENNQPCLFGCGGGL